MHEAADSANTDAAPRNLILVSFDQWRGDWCDPHAPVVELPNITGLARRGWSARCYATAPQCVPARLSWTTALYPSQFGVTTHRNIDLPGSAPSIIRTLQKQGWWTELVGKSHLTAHVKGRDLRNESSRMHELGFNQVLEIAGPRGLRHVECALTDAWKDAGVFEKQRADLELRYAGGRKPESWSVRPTILPLELYPDIWLTQQATKRLAALPTNQPWLLWISFVGPHEPFDTPKPWSGHHTDAMLPPPAEEPPWLENLPRHASARRTRATWKELTSESITACRRDYADNLQLLDDQVGELMKALSKRSDAARTAIALTADHGELLGDGGMLYKGTFLEGAVRVPWIYSPAPVENLHDPMRTENPVGITQLLEQCLHQLASGGTTDDLLTWMKDVPDVCCEYADELMIVSGMRKVILDARRRPLWAVDLERDPLEQENVISSDPQAWRHDSRWRTLRRSARRHYRQRRRRNWRVMQLEDVQ